MSDIGISILRFLLAGAVVLALLTAIRGLTADVRGIAVAVIVIGFLTGCSLYHRPWNVKPISEGSKYDFRVVQLDDFGSFWDAAEARNVANEIDTWSQQGNLFVVVFVHGWHHNAQSDDGNLLSFQESLKRIAQLMDEPAFANAREQLTHRHDYRLVGVYIGWRGKSLPMPLDYATMWWRKSAAERVGDGDVAEFLERLQRSYLRANSTDPHAGNAIYKPFMGLITIGHSFGGQVLMKALARPMESDLILRTQCRMADTTHPSTQDPSAELEREPIDSYGDVNILLNPALEAAQFARIDSLYRHLKYSASQTPQLLILSADDDWARQAFFPIARYLTLPFRPTFTNDYQAQLWSQALGELRSQQTHDLNPTDDLTDSLTATDYEDPKKIRDFDFTGPLTFQKVKLTPRNAVPNSPVAVVYTHRGIIKQHSGIFEDSLRNFLVQYVAFLEAKRMLLRHDRLEIAFSGKGHPPIARRLTCPD